MAYAESVKSPGPKKKHLYWRGRYHDGTYFDSGRPRYVSVRDDEDNVIRFKSKREAEQAADAKEASVRKGTLPAGGDATFTAFSSWWLENQNVAWSTIANRRQHLQNHLIPFFGDYTLRYLEQHPELVGQWEQYERQRKYAENSIATWRGTLTLCLGDAVPKRIGSNPAEKKKGRGRRTAAGRNTRAGGGKVITNPLGMFLIAERMSILTGRDAEFIMVMTGYWHALRLGELIGLEPEFVTPAGVDVQWQLHKLASVSEDLKEEAPGGLLRCEPKDGSVGLVPSPPFMASMLAGYKESRPWQPCGCHGRPYLFNGFGERPRPRGPVTMREVAEKAGVSRSDVSAVVNGGRSVSVAKRAAIEKAVKDTGYEPAPKPGGNTPHWRAADFEEMFSAAASGMLKPRDGYPERPVPLTGEWPGVRIRGRNAGKRSELKWDPVAPGMTPHGWRHAAKTLMEEHGIPEVVSESRLRHLLPGVSGTYRQVTPTMAARLLEFLTEQWEETLDARLGMSPTSTVGIVGRLLRERSEARNQGRFPRDSPEGGASVIQMPYRTASDLRQSQ